MKKIFLLLFIGMCCLTLVHAEESGGDLIGKVSDCISLPQECASCSYVNLTTVVYPDMTTISIQAGMTKVGSSYNRTFCNTTQLGSYSYCTLQDVDGVDTSVCKDFQITPNGEVISTGKVIFYVVGLLILLIFFLISLLGLFQTKDYKGKFALYWVGHLSFVAITFICWDMAVDFLTDSNFIEGMFKVLFYFSVIAIFPVMIFSIAGMVIYLSTLKEVQRLIDKGMPEAEAYRRQGRKFK